MLIALARHHGDMPVAYAILSQKITDAGSVQLLPLGEFAAKDGRPGTLENVTCQAWKLTRERAEKIVAAFAARKNDLLIDYEHATLFKKGTGDVAPAAGWASAFVLKDDGLHAEPVEWTPRAAKMIDDKEIRYSSPVFSFDPTTGDVLDISMCAITNDPALDGMAELQAALTRMGVPTEATQALSQTITTDTETAMDELLERIRWFLNLPIAATVEDIIAELDKLKAKLTEAQQAAASFDLLSYFESAGNDASQVAALSQEVATLRTQSAPDPAKFVPIASLTAAHNKIAELSVQLQGNATEGVIAAAAKEGRLLGEADIEWARAFAKQHGAAALQGALSARAPIAALSGTQTGGKPPVGSAKAALSAEEQAAATFFGQSAETYSAARDA